MKKIPIRSCVGCGKERPKSEMIRIVRTPEGEYVLDRSGKQNGRGAYLCPDPECLKTALKRKSLDRSFRAAVPGDALRRLEEEMSLFAEGS